MEERTRWSIGVYLAGGDGLNEGMVRALKEMRDEAVPGKNVQVLAQFEPRNKIPRLFAFPRHQIPPDAALPRKAPPRQNAHALARYEYLLERPSREDSPTSCDLLSQFVRLGASIGSADNAMLVLSGHGNGAVGELFGFRGANRSLRIRDLSHAISRACLAPCKKIDIIGMDCCNMSMVEIGFELAPYARFLVASESIVPNHGWPYRQILDRIVPLSAAGAASEIVRQYSDFYEDFTLLGMASHCAATDLGEIEGLAAPVRALAEVLLARIFEPDVWRPVVLAHWEAQSYKNEEYVDLVDFCERLERHIGASDVRRCCRDVVAAVGQVVKASEYTGASFQYSRGLSIYFPWSNDAAKGRGEFGHPSDLDLYKGLVFNEKTLWGEFLDAYLHATRRQARVVRSEESADTVSVAVMEARDSANRPNGASERPSTNPMIGNIPFKEEDMKEKDSGLGGRRVPPFGRGGSDVTSTIKNFPTEEAGLREDGDSGLGGRRVPPFGRGSGTEPSSTIKNHPK